MTMTQKQWVARGLCARAVVGRLPATGLTNGPINRQLVMFVVELSAVQCNDVTLCASGHTWHDVQIGRTHDAQQRK